MKQLKLSKGLKTIVIASIIAILSLVFVNLGSLQSPAQSTESQIVLAENVRSDKVSESSSLTKQNSTKIEEQELRKKLTKILVKADIMFGLRNLLAKAGVPKNEPLIAVFKYEEENKQSKVLSSNVIPPLTSTNYTYVGTKSVDLSEELAEVLSKTELEYKLADVLEAAGFPREGEHYISIEFKYGQEPGEEFEYKLSSGANYYCPCYPGLPFDCWR